MVVAWILAVITHWLKQPLILAYLVAGFAMGPTGFGVIKDRDSVSNIASLGLLFLLFMIGLEIDLKKMLRAGRSISVTSVVQILGGAVLGVVFFKICGFPLGDGGLDALYLGVAAALSSTVIIVKILYDKRELDTLAGRVTLGVLVLQDMFAIIFLALQPSLNHPSVTAVLVSLGKAGILVAVSLLLSRYILPPVFKSVARLPELVLVGAIAWCFTMAGVGGWLGLSREMGALVAGVAMSTFPYALDVTAKITGLRDFFVTLFFVTLGMLIPSPSVKCICWSLAIAAFVVASRFATVFPSLHWMRMGHRISFLPSLYLSQISEFSLVILALGGKPELNHISPETTGYVGYAFAFLAVLSTIGITRSESIFRAAQSLMNRIGFHDLYHDKETKEAEAHTPRIVILGFFWTASSLLEEIRRHHPSLLAEVGVVDFNPHVNSELRKRGVHVHYGDITQRETLIHTGVDKAEIILCTIPNSLLKGATNLRLLHQLREINPDAHIIMHADVFAEMEDLYKAGASYVSLPRLYQASELCEVIHAARNRLIAEKRKAQDARLHQRNEVMG